MRYKRFEELPVWNDAAELARGVFELSTTGAFRLMSGLKDQIERATISVSNNIAEGFERGTNGELLTFLYIAKGSVAEVRSMLCIMERIDPELRLQRTVAEPKRIAESISRQLCGWIESLKDSGFEGPRSQTDRTRQGQERARRAEECAAHLREVVARARNPRPDDGPPSIPPDSV